MTWHLPMDMTTTARGAAPPSRPAAATVRAGHNCPKAMIAG